MSEKRQGTSMSSWSAPGSPASAPATTCRPTAPTARYAILEGRADIGGTWDLFRYPGVRSDSDMHTLGYSFKPWTGREGDRRRAVDPRRTCARPSPSTASTGTSASDHLVSSGRVVDRRRPVDGHARSRTRHRRDRSTFTCGYLFMCSGLLQLQGRLHARVPRHRATSTGRSCTRRRGRTTSTTPASGSWSSAPVRRR